MVIPRGKEGGGSRRGQGGKMVREGDEHIIQYTDDVLWNCTPQTTINSIQILKEPVSIYNPYYNYIPVYSLQQLAHLPTLFIMELKEHFTLGHFVKFYNFIYINNINI